LPLSLITAVILAAPLAAAEPEYATIRMEIGVARPATAAWAQVGKYCDIREWMNVDCKVTSQ